MPLDLARRPAPRPRLKLLRGARVYTLDAAEREAEALVIDGARIAAVGSPRDLEARFPHAEVWDLSGRAVVPGFVDPHHHLLLAATYAGAVDCRPLRCPDRESLLKRLQEGANGLAPDAWLVGYGYDPAVSHQGRITRDDLDAVCDGRPVALVHFSFHDCVANSAALARAGIDLRSADPHGGKIERDRRGRPTGELREMAMARVENLARASLLAGSRPEILERLREAQRALLRLGITRITDPGVSSDFLSVYREARDRGWLQIPIAAMPISDQGLLCAPWDRLTSEPTGSGDEMLRISSLKLVFDGAERCALCLSIPQVVKAAVRTLRPAPTPVAPAPATSTVRLGRDLHLHAGHRFLPGADAHCLAEIAVERGFSLAIHAMGNEAMAQALDTIEGVRGDHADAPPPRIEHALVSDTQLLRRAADLGVALVVQPEFVGALAERDLRTLESFRLLALASMRDAGCCVASSSDAPAAGFDPLDSLRAAVRRRVREGAAPLQPEESVDPAEWLQMATRDAARVSGCIEEAGTLEVGKRADLVVLSEDLLAPQCDLDALHVRATVLGGELVYARRAEARDPRAWTEQDRREVSPVVAM